MPAARAHDQDASAGGRRRKRHLKISAGQAWNLHEAWRFAVWIGRAPTLFVTINWRFAPSSTYPDSIARMSRVRDCMKSFLHRHTGQGPVWMEVREDPKSRGDHVHLALYVPAWLEPAFRKALKGWVSMDAQGMEGRAIKTKPIYDWVGLQRYFLKGATREVRQLFSVPPRHSPFQGVIHGPRVRVSHSIGPTARKAAGFATAANRGLAANA